MSTVTKYVIKRFSAEINNLLCFLFLLDFLYCWLIIEHSFSKVGFAAVSKFFSRN